MFVRVLLPLAAAFAVVLPAVADTLPIGDAEYSGVVSLAVDATDLDHRIFRVRERIPVAPGPLTLDYPEWLPGNHAPRGPIDKLAGLSIRANGEALRWTRASNDVYAFHVDVPAGVAQLDVEFEFLSPQDRAEGRVVVTPEMLNLQWNTVLLYPAGFRADRVRFAPRMTIPGGWKYATALEADGAADGATIRFKPVTLETLVDSPVLAGRHFRRIDLDPGGRIPVHLDVFADDEADLDAKPDEIKAHRELVTQASRLFDSHHYDHYDFLFSLSSNLSHIGLEHHRSSEDGVDPDYFTDWNRRAPERDLLAHEYTHSWNGKFRRPADLATPNYNVPMGDSLLWVYEGQTQLWGYVLAARSGLISKDQARDVFALVASRYADNRPGFSWRDIEDTTNDPVAVHRQQEPYRNYQMSEEYYSAGLLLWLAVDQKLRDLSHGRRSLDDFARRFFGVDDGSWNVEPYTFDDVVRTLDSIESYDWTTFLKTRLEANAPPLDGIEASGWKLVYTDTPSALQKLHDANAKSIDASVSIGLTLSTKDGRITDVRWNGPAFRAGVPSEGILVAVDGREFTAERFDRALARAKQDGAPIELLVHNGDRYRTFAVDYRGGAKYPHLERIDGRPDRLDALFEPRR